MGLHNFGRCSSSPYAAPESNPDPKNFTIEEAVVVENSHGGKNLLLKAHYPDCKNFEGRKILVYKGIGSLEELMMLTCNELDPHFSNSDKPSPIGRFTPTAEGLSLAFIIARVV